MCTSPCHCMSEDCRMLCLWAVFSCYIWATFLLTATDSYGFAESFPYFQESCFFGLEKNQHILVSFIKVIITKESAVSQPPLCLQDAFPTLHSIMAHSNIFLLCYKNRNLQGFAIKCAEFLQIRFTIAVWFLGGDDGGRSAVHFTFSCPCLNTYCFNSRYREIYTDNYQIVKGNFFCWWNKKIM